MRYLRHALVVTAVLAAVVAFGAIRNKSTPVNAAHFETATLAGGCFWGLQESLRQIPGVIKTTVGYTGGTVPNPTYEQVAAGKSGHIEAVQVIYDPARLTFEQLLANFMTSGKPAQPSPRVIAPHRSTIFYSSESQRITAEQVKDSINQSSDGNAPIATEITRAAKFYPAEEFHQNYYQKMAAHTCRVE